MLRQSSDFFDDSEVGLFCLRCWLAGYCPSAFTLASSVQYIDAEDLEISNGDACRYHDAWKELVQAK